MKLTSFFLFLTITSSVQAKLLDKIIGIIDDNIVTLSQVQRATKSLPLKKNIAPMIYDKQSFTNEEMLSLTVNRYLIRSKLTELGMPVSDDQVDGQIKVNEKRLNVNREQLKSFLKTQNATYDEYFETLREAMEYSFFVSRVITPLISISEQEIKNEYIKQNSKDTRLNIKFTLIDYAISKDMRSKNEKEEFEKAVKQYRSNNVLSDTFSSISINNLDDLTEEGLAPELKNALKITDEGKLSNVINYNGQSHVFFVVKKDLVETDAFAKQKEKIKDQIFEKIVKDEVTIWFEREKNKHYIKISI
jgi:peptidyl-prolyl cis-trans isomerase SurA